MLYLRLELNAVADLFTHQSNAHEHRFYIYVHVHKLFSGVYICKEACFIWFDLTAAHTVDRHGLNIHAYLPGTQQKC